MSVKLYVEIEKFIKNQLEVLRSFENETNYKDNSDINKLLNSLYYNIHLFEERVEKRVNE